MAAAVSASRTWRAGALGARPQCNRASAARHPLAVRPVGPWLATGAADLPSRGHRALEAGVAEPGPAQPEARTADQLAELEPNEVLLQLEGTDKALRANKVLLGLMSPVLHDAFAIEPDCKALKVTGTVAAWQRVVDYPLMDTATRNAAVGAKNDTAAAVAMAEVLEVADKYRIQLLQREWDAFATSWTNFTLDVGSLKTDSGPTPNTPAWWINVATKYDRPQVAGRAMGVLLGRGSYIQAYSHYQQVVQLSDASRVARHAHKDYGKKQPGQLWAAMCALLEACDNEAQGHKTTERR